MSLTYPGHWKERYYDKGPKYNKIKEIIDAINMSSGPLADHSGRHEDGGLDEINVGGLSGELADPQPPKTHASTHASGAGDALTDVCFLTGNQTIGGTKTFSSIPVLPGSDPTQDNQATRKAYVDSKLGVIFDMNWWTYATNDIPGFIKYDQGGTTAMDSNTYFKMISSTVLEAKKIAADPVAQAKWWLVTPCWTGGGLKLSWEWKRSGTWWSASTNFYFSPYWLIQNTVTGDARWISEAMRFSNLSSPANYDWQWYNGTSYVDTNCIVGTSWTTMEMEMMPQAYPGDAYAMRLRWRHAGGSWTEGYGRTDTWLQAGLVVLGFIGFQMYCGSTSAYWDLEMRNIKLEMLKLNWEP